MSSMIKHKTGYLVFFTYLILLILISCKYSEKPEYNYYSPDYSQLALGPTNDTLVFSANNLSSNYIKSFNYFVDEGKEYMSFYDRQAQSIFFYDFVTKALIHSIKLKDCFKTQKLYKTTIYCKNFDTIFVNNHLKLFLIDSSGKIKDSVTYPTSPYAAIASFDNMNPVVFKGDLVYAEARPRKTIKNIDDLEDWCVLYEINLSSKSARVLYNLPESYLKGLYSYNYFYNSYCYNKNDKFVFSFPADTNIYETDLETYHHSYFAKSKFNTGMIQTATNEELGSGEGSTRSFLMNDSYSAIFYDKYRNKYLRIAQKKLSRESYVKRRWDKDQSVIIMDDNFKIIGESSIDNRIALSTLFFKEDGQIYARTRFDDTSNIHFIRLSYSDSKLASIK